MSIGTTVKAIQDIMRKDAGVDGDAQRLNQLGWMLFFKIFSDGEEELEMFQDDYRSPIPSACAGRTGRPTPKASPARRCSTSSTTTSSRRSKTFRSMPMRRAVARSCARSSRMLSTT